MISGFCCGRYEAPVFGWSDSWEIYIRVAADYSRCEGFLSCLSLQQISITENTRLGSHPVSPFGDPPSFETSMPKSLHLLLTYPQSKRKVPGGWTNGSDCTPRIIPQQLMPKPYASHDQSRVCISVFKI